MSSDLPVGSEQSTSLVRGDDIEHRSAVRNAWAGTAIRIINEGKDVNRVVYDATSKPSGSIFCLVHFILPYRTVAVDAEKT